MARLLTPRWLARHLLVLGVVAAFLALGWWQVRRAEAGNVLSYAYAVEWPVFAAFVVALWVRELRAALRPRAVAPPQPPPPQPDAPGYVPFAAAPARPEVRPDDGADPELAAYNRYLAWLAADPERRPDEYRDREDAP